MWHTPRAKAKRLLWQCRKEDNDMKVTIDVPRTFEITLKQMDNFLVSSGWNSKKEHNENTVSYQCVKYPNVFVILPKGDRSLVDSEYMVFTALRLIANVNNNCGIETIINRVVGVES